MKINCKLHKISSVLVLSLAASVSMYAMAASQYHKEFSYYKDGKLVGTSILTCYGNMYSNGDITGDRVLEFKEKCFD